MDTTDRGFVDHWRKITPILVNVERQRLREYTDAERRKEIEAILDLQINLVTSHVSTGLIEQQRLSSRQRS